MTDQLGSNRVQSFVNVAAATPDCSWEAKADSAAYWIVMSGGATRTGSGAAEYVVQENLDGQPRTGTLRSVAKWSPSFSPPRTATRPPTVVAPAMAAATGRAPAATAEDNQAARQPLGIEAPLTRNAPSVDARCPHFQTTQSPRIIALKDRPAAFREVDDHQALPSARTAPRRGSEPLVGIRTLCAASAA